MADILADVLKEMSASGAAPAILSPEGKSLTLRQAVAEMFGKVRAVLSLSGRPRDPRAGDDLYGHLLSLRAENLILLEVVFELARQQDIDPQEIRNRVIASLSS
jgi:chromosome condensin MukBEF MukE localization factor